MANNSGQLQKAAEQTVKRHQLTLHSAYLTKRNPLVSLLFKGTFFTHNTVIRAKRKVLFNVLRILRAQVIKVKTPFFALFSPPILTLSGPRIWAFNIFSDQKQRKNRVQHLEGQKRRNENTPLFMRRKRPGLLIAASDERLEEHLSDIHTTNNQSNNWYYNSKFPSFATMHVPLQPKA